VTDEQGSRLTFIVKKVQSYKTEESPLEEIFGFSAKTSLNLITCAGIFNRETQESDKRLVVYTEFKE
jgi:hypothetical protein